MMGTERKSMVMTEDEKRMTAYHEAGHAIVALHEPASDPIHKATIIPRGRALGMVMRLPERDNYSYHRDKMYANLAVSMGGRVAEEMIFGYDKVSLGRLVRHQLCDRPRPRHGHPLGHVRRARPAAICRGRRGSVPRLFGQPPAATCRTRPRRRSTRKSAASSRKAMTAPSICSTEHREELETLAKALLEYETLSRRRDQEGARRRDDRPRRRQGPGDPGGRLVDPEGQAAQAGQRSAARRRPAPKRSARADRRPPSP